MRFHPATILSRVLSSSWRRLPSRRARRRPQPLPRFEKIEERQLLAETFSVGEVVNDAIDAAGEVDEWAFDLEGRETLFLDFHSISSQDSSDLEYELRGPSGETLYDDGDDDPD